MILGITPNFTPRIQTQNRQPNYMAKTNYKEAGNAVSFSAKAVFKPILPKTPPAIVSERLTPGAKSLFTEL